MKVFHQSCHVHYEPLLFLSVENSVYFASCKNDDPILRVQIFCNKAFKWLRDNDRGGYVFGYDNQFLNAAGNEWMKKQGFCLFHCIFRLLVISRSQQQIGTSSCIDLKWFFSYDIFTVWSKMSWSWKGIKTVRCMYDLELHQDNVMVTGIISRWRWQLLGKQLGWVANDIWRLVITYVTLRQTIM